MTGIWNVPNESTTGRSIQNRIIQYVDIIVIIHRVIGLSSLHMTSLIIFSTMRPHNRINDQAKSRETTTPDSTGLRSSLGLHRRASNASAQHRIPYIVFASVPFDQALGAAEYARDERELLAPVQALIGRGPERGARLLGQRRLRHVLAVNRGYGGRHVG